MENYPDFPSQEAFDEEYDRGLVRLSRVRYELAEGQPDAMGWKVRDVEGVDFGEVSDLLADAETGQIVFIAVTHEDTGKTTLVPVEGMFLDMANELVVLPVTEADVADSPEFNDDVVDISPYISYWTNLAKTTG